LAEVVQLDRVLHDADFSAVVLDNHWAGECVAAHLLQHSIRTATAAPQPRRLLVVAGPEHSRISRERLAGLHDALAASGHDMAVDVLWGDYTLEPARIKVAEYLDNHGIPRAIFGMTQLITLGALRALKEHGVNRDTLDVISIDRLPYLDIFDIRVPCVVHDGLHTGQQALELLLQRV